MTHHAKASTLNLIGALILAATVLLRHTSTDSTVLNWADNILPVIGFVLIAAGLYYMIQAKKEPRA